VTLLGLVLVLVVVGVLLWALQQFPAIDANIKKVIYVLVIVVVVIWLASSLLGGEARGWNPRLW